MLILIVFFKHSFTVLILYRFLIIIYVIKIIVFIIINEIRIKSPNYKIFSEKYKRNEL